MCDSHDVTPREWGMNESDAFDAFDDADAPLFDGDGERLASH